MLKSAPVCGHSTAGLFFSRFNPQAPQARDSCNPKPDSDPRSDPEILVRERDGLMSKLVTGSQTPAVCI